MRIIYLACKRASKGEEEGAATEEVVCRDQSMEVEDRGVVDDDDEVVQKVEEDVEDLVVEEDKIQDADDDDEVVQKAVGYF